MSEKPTVAFILSLIGGIFVLIGGLILWFVGAVLTFFLFGVGGIFGIFGTICGLLMIIGAVMMYSNPRSHISWSIVVLIFAILSWIGALGGLLIGFILGLIGGILGIIWRPSITQVQPLSPQAPINRVCPNCGNVIERNIKFCPHCGKELP
jgi:hypothetical protein